MVVEGIVGVYVERLQLEDVVGQGHLLPVLARCELHLEVVGVLIGQVEAEATAVGAEAQLGIVVLAPEFGGVDGTAERESAIADVDADGRLDVGGEIHLLRLSAGRAVYSQARPRQIVLSHDGPLGLWAGDVVGVDV